MRRLAFILTIAFLFSVSKSPVTADRGVGSIDLSANPGSIIADGKSTCTISAEVRDRDGRLVPDGTEVRFSASLGVIDETAETSAGVARVKLTSSDLHGASVVTATWVDGEAVSQVNVEFGNAESLPQGPEYVAVDADEYLAYSADYRVIDAMGRVRIRHRSLELEAHEVQIDLELNRIVAKGGGRANPLKLYTAEGILPGDMFVCDLMGSRGLILSVESGRVQEIDLSKSRPRVTENEPQYTPEEFELIDLSDSSVLVKARQAILFPNDKIQFKRANVYVNGKRILSLPYYVLSLTGYSVDGEQYVGYGTGGLTLSLPFYYAVSPSSSGALLVRHGESTGWGDYGQKPGWFIDLRQKYATERSQGTLALSRVTGADWGAQFTHNQEIDDDTRAFLFLDYPAHRDLFGSLNLSKSSKAFDIGLDLSGGKYQDSGDSWLTNLSVRTRSKRVGNLPLKYTLSTRLAYAAGSSIDSDGMTESLQGNIHSDPIAVGRNLTLRSSLGLGYVWSEVGSSGLSSLATAMLDWNPSRHTSLQISYRFADRAGVYASTTSGRQTLSANLRLGDGRKWQASVYAIRGLDYSSTNVFGNINYRLDKNWRIGLRSTTNKYGDLSYNDLELSLGRTLGNRELIAVWSKSQRKIMFELGSAGF